MPDLETPAAAVVESATTPKTYNGWDEQGVPIVTPEKQDSAPAEKSKDAVADSAPQKKEEKSAVASESATDKEKPHLKTKEDTEKRFSELLEFNKNLQRQLDELKKPAPRESKQESQPAPDFKRLDEKDYFAKNPKASYEDFVDAAAEHRAKYLTDKAIREYAATQQQQAAHKELSTRIESVKQLYPDFTERTNPAIAAFTDPKQVHPALMSMIDSSPVFEHLLYTLAEGENLKDFLATAKANPAAAARKLFLTEQLIQAELAKASKGGDGKEAKRDESGKFVADKKEESSKDKEDVASETKPRAKSKVPAEVSARGTGTEDAAKDAAANGNFSRFEQEMNRRVRASQA